MIGNKYYSVFEIIQQALLNVGAVSFGESIEAAVSQAALMQMNNILRKWSNSYMNFKSYDQIVYPTNPTSVIYMGMAVDGEFPTPTVGDIDERPASIDQVDIIMGTLTFPVAIKTYSEYTKIPLKNVVSIPSACYFREGMPFDELWFYPAIPASYGVRVVGKAYLPQYTNISQAVVLPPEYVEALIYTLATHLAPIFGQNAPEGLIMLMNSALKHIKQRNSLNNIQRLKNDFNSMGSRNFWSGQ
jgi:hypothetical protein